MLLLTILLIFYFPSFSPTQVTIYGKKHFQSPSSTLTVTSCTSPLPLTPLSLKIEGTEGCVNAYSGKNCTLHYFPMRFNSPKSEDLIAWLYWHEWVASLGSCINYCDQPEEEKPDLEVTIYQRRSKVGAHTTLAIKSGKCTTFPSDFRKKVSSLKWVLSNDSCFRLWERPNCIGKSVEQRNSIIQNSLAMEVFEKKASSVSFCDYGCRTKENIDLVGELTNEGIPQTFPTTSVDLVMTTVTRNIIPTTTSAVNKTTPYPTPTTTRPATTMKTNLTIETTTTLLTTTKSRVTITTLPTTTTSKITTTVPTTTTPTTTAILTVPTTRTVPTSTAIPATTTILASATTQIKTPRIVSESSTSPSLNESNENEIDPHTFAKSTNATTAHLPNPVPKEESILLSPHYLMICIAVLILVLIIVLLGIMFVLLGQQKFPPTSIPLLPYETMPPKFLDHFYKGCDPKEIIDDSGAFASANYTQACYKPYDQSFEVNKKDVIIGQHDILGFGQFGVVYKGVWNKGGVKKEVAVKTVKQNASFQYIASLMSEIKIMIWAGQHPNILHLLGCFTTNVTKGELFILIDVCENGSLIKFLQKKRGEFVDLRPAMSCANQYESHKKSNQRNKEFADWEISIFHLVEWSLEIAEAMHHLANKQIIHGDLACRNVLLDSRLRVKFSDFGLSRQMLHYTEYIKQNKEEPLPWRWLAIESLKNLRFSTESDIWAYGVTMWEIFSLGGLPFPFHAWNHAFVNQLCEGLRLERPKFSLNECYHIMQSCWKEGPEYRIKFAEIIKTLAQLKKELLLKEGPLKQLVS